MGRLKTFLPAHAQDNYIAAFNAAWMRYAEREPCRREEIAHRVAWAAVKRGYRKEGERWIKR